MRKIKVFVVSLLAALAVLLCFAGCGEKGIYRIEAYEIPSIGITKEVEANMSYVELKKDGVAEVSIDLGVIGKKVGTGTWEKTDEKNRYILTLDEVEYPIMIVDEEMIIEMDFANIVLEKED